MSLSSLSALTQSKPSISSKAPDYDPLTTILKKTTSKDGKKDKSVINYMDVSAEMKETAPLMKNTVKRVLEKAEKSLSKPQSKEDAKLSKRIENIFYGDKEKISHLTSNSKLTNGLKESNSNSKLMSSKSALPQNGKKVENNLKKPDNKPKPLSEERKKFLEMSRNYEEFLNNPEKLKEAFELTAKINKKKKAKITILAHLYQNPNQKKPFTRNLIKKSHHIQTKTTV